MLTSNGGVTNLDAPWYGSPKADGVGDTLAGNPVVGIAATASGYDVLRASGGVDNFHTAWDGSLADHLPTGVHAVAIAAWPGILTVTTVSLPAPVGGSSYATTLGASGGLPPYRWSLISGSLPAGVVLSTGGTISGIPTTPGPSAFGIQVRDALGIAVTRAFSLTTGPTPPLSWSKPVSIDPLRGSPSSVSCATSTFCMAVDLYGNALSWNGKTWSAPVAIEEGTWLAAVSCPSGLFCAVVDNGSNALLGRA